MHTYVPTHIHTHSHTGHTHWAPAAQATAGCPGTHLPALFCCRGSAPFASCRACVHTAMSSPPSTCRRARSFLQRACASWVVSHENESCLMWTSHVFVTAMRASWVVVTWKRHVSSERVMSRLNESCVCHGNPCAHRELCHMNSLSLSLSLALSLSLSLSLFLACIFLCVSLTHTFTHIDK